MKTIRTVSDFDNWLTDARRGERATYYRGHLAASDPLHLHEMKRALLKATEAGQVVLCQKRHGEDDYEYFVERTGP